MSLPCYPRRHFTSNKIDNEEQRRFHWSTEFATFTVLTGERQSVLAISHFKTISRVHSLIVAYRARSKNILLWNISVFPKLKADEFISMT